MDPETVVPDKLHWICGSAEILKIQQRDTDIKNAWKIHVSMHANKDHTGVLTLTCCFHLLEMNKPCCIRERSVWINLSIDDRRR